MAQPVRGATLPPLERIVRAIGRFVRGIRVDDPLVVRLEQAGSADTPLNRIEAADLDEARAEIRRGEYTVEPRGPER